MPEVVPGYKPRPLIGVWATPPFLHNGSVPNLYELLSPLAERRTRFVTGTREFDPVKVGYRSDTLDEPGVLVDTTQSGNRNIGHLFDTGYVPFDPSKPADAQFQYGLIGPRLSESERYAIVEYLKWLPGEERRRAKERQQSARVPPDCFALLNPSSIAAK
ncbi:MAG: hypothetical protein QM736_02900 [Vicinamibacterales bacterium]